MRQAFGILFAALTIPASMNSTKTEPLNSVKVQKINKLIRDCLEEYKIPGLSLAVISENESYSKGCGFRNLDKNLTTNDETLFAVGSLIQQITSLLIINELHARFPELRENVLDTPINTLLPGYILVLRDKFRTEQVTFRDLLAHKVCVPSNAFGYYYGTFNTTKELLYRERYAKELCGFRDAFQYSHTMYALAWDAFEHLTNQSFPDAVQSFFNLLGMSRSTTLNEQDNNAKFDCDGKAQSYAYVNGDSYQENVQTMKGVLLVGPAGSILSSAKDMLKYLRFQLNKGRINGTQVFSEAVFRWQRQVSKALLLGNFRNADSTASNRVFGYGLGVAIEEYDGYFRIAHYGGMSSYLSYLVFYPYLGIGIFVSVNGGTGIDLQEVGNSIFGILQGRSVTRKLILDTEPETNETWTIKGEMSGFFMPEDFLPGKYGNAMCGEIEIYSIISNRFIKYRVAMGRNGPGTLERYEDRSATFAVTLDEEYYGYPQNATEYFIFVDMDHFVLISESIQFFRR